MDINILHYPGNYLQLIHQAGRNCYGMTSDISMLKMDELKKYTMMMISDGHESVIEHINITWSIKDVSRSLMAQLTRHRHCSFSIKSQHFVKHQNFKYKELERYIDHGQRTAYYELMLGIDQMYCLMVKDGLPHHIAREILPNACLTDIIMTCNMRQLRHILKLRITKNNTLEIIQMSKEILKICNKMMPELVHDIKMEEDIE